MAYPSLLSSCIPNRERLHFFIHSPVDEHWGCFQCLAIPNKTAIKLRYVIWIYAFIFGGEISRSGMAES